MRKLLGLLLVLSVFVALPAWAKKVQYRKTQEVNFDAVDVDGKAKSPDAAYLNQKKGVEFLPSYQVRQNFEVRIKESADYLR
jgi:hypothetical protein